MRQYIEKDILAAEIKKLIDEAKIYPSDFYCGRLSICKELMNFLDTIEVKEVDTWHLQEKENIYDAVKDWSLHTFACIMKDGTIQMFSGCLAEDCEGHINVHIDGVNDDYDNVDDIVKWIECI